MRNEDIWNLIAKKLSGEASLEELSDLENQLHINPDMYYSLQVIIDLWNPEPDFDREEAHQAFNRHIERMGQFTIDPSPGNLYAGADIMKTYPGQVPAYTHKKIAFWLAMAFVLIFGLVFWGTRFFNSPSTQNILPGYASLQDKKTISEISTKNGSKTSIVLPDGTLVKLNAGSKLTYDKDYGNTIREVTLTGEAFFDVEKNAGKPFIIHTSKMDIKVLGTRFNVKSYPADKTTEATLIRGSIEVSIKDRPAQKLILRPNEKLIVTNDDTSLAAFAKGRSTNQTSNPIVAISHLNYAKKDSTIIETAWVQNKLIFRDEPFRELALQMERWYSVSIHFGDPSKEEIQFTGVFENESIQQALAALKLSGKFNYSMRDNEVFISK